MRAAAPQEGRGVEAPVERDRAEDEIGGRRSRTTASRRRSSDALEAAGRVADGPPKKKRTRRGTRGGRGRKKPGAAATARTSTEQRRRRARRRTAGRRRESTCLRPISRLRASTSGQGGGAASREGEQPSRRTSRADRGAVEAEGERSGRGRRPDADGQPKRKRSRRGSRGGKKRRKPTAGDGGSCLRGRESRGRCRRVEVVPDGEVPEYVPMSEWIDDFDARSRT